MDQTFEGLSVDEEFLGEEHSGSKYSDQKPSVEEAEQSEPSKKR